MGGGPQRETPDIGALDPKMNPHSGRGTNMNVRPSGMSAALSYGADEQGGDMVQLRKKASK